MPRGEHRPSVLLSKEENEMVFSMIGPKCQSLATAVVQLFTTEGPAHSEWKKRDTGVLCLIKDNGKRSYFFRIYCLYRKMLVWEHEVYLQIEYKSPRPFLHTFEAEEYMTAFNFANEEEARLLRTILIEKIELRKVKREEKRQRAALAQRANSASAARQNGAPPPAPAAAPTPAPLLPPKAQPMTAGSTYTLKGSKKPKGRPKLTKADIGLPQDFKHISHVGWDQHKGFDVDKLPNEELRSFFSKAGVSETQLEDEDTRDFIYGFIETHGGLDAVKEDLYKPAKNARGPLPLPATPAPPVPARSPAPAHPPAPPSRAPPPPPSRVVPPPPAPLAPRNPPPPRPPQRTSVVGAAPRAAAPPAGRGAPSSAAARAPRRRPAPAPAARRRGRGARRESSAHGEHPERERDAQARGADAAAAAARRQQEQLAQRDPTGDQAQSRVPVDEQLGQLGARAGAGRGAGARARGAAEARARRAQPRHPGQQRRRRQHRRVQRRRLGLAPFW